MALTLWQVYTTTAIFFGDLEYLISILFLPIPCYCHVEEAGRTHQLHDWIFCSKCN